MKTQQISTQKTIVARFAKGEDLYNSLGQVAEKHQIKHASFQAIGAVSACHLACYENRDYTWQKYAEAFEMVSCTGNVSLKEGKPFIHCHAVFSCPEGRIVAGHIGEGCIIDPTAEVHFSIYNEEIARRYDEETGLWLLDI